MAKDCVGEGTGWGTVENVTLRILLLVSPDRDADGVMFSGAFQGRHEVTRVSGPTGFAPSFAAARAARETSPHLVHALGLTGYAKAAPTVAAGISRPFVLTLDASQIEADEKRALKLAARADAVIVDRTETANVLRGLGIERDLYVIGLPTDASAATFLLGALEIVYGRVLGASDTELEEDNTFEVDADGGQLVQIGRATRGPTQRDA